MHSNLQKHNRLMNFKFLRMNKKEEDESEDSAKKDYLRIDHVLQAKEQPERLILKRRKILLEITSFALGYQYASRCLLHRVQNYVSISLLERLHFLQHAKRIKKRKIPCFPAQRQKGFHDFQISEIGNQKQTSKHASVEK